MATINLINASGRTLKAGDPVKMHATKKNSFDYAELGAIIIGTLASQTNRGSYGVINLLGSSVAAEITQTQIDAIIAQIPPASVELTPEQIADIVSQVPPTDITSKVDKVTGEALLATTEAAKIHALNADNQDLSGLVATSITVNGHALSANVTVSKSDVSLGAVDNIQQMPLSYLDTDGALVANSDVKVASQKAVKTYVDQLALGLVPKPSAHAATTTTLPTNTYNNGASGVGATLTAITPGVLTIDGITLALNDYVLVKNETLGYTNGLYVVTTAGAIGVAYILTRDVTMNQSTEFSNSLIVVENGTANAGTIWLDNNNGSITVGTTVVTFTQIPTAGAPIAGTGISISGTTVSIDTAVTVDKTTTQTLTGKTIDGVTPTVMGYVDPTSSIQTQLNGKQASGTYATGTGSASGTNTGDETAARVAVINHAASVKSALVDADEITGQDSAATFGLIRFTWTSVKAFLKTYFDGLYNPKRLFANLAAPVVSSGTTEKVLLQLQIPAARAVVGSTFRAWIVGNSSSTGTLIFRIKSGVNGTIADTEDWKSVTSAAQAANARAGFECLITIRSATTIAVAGVGYAGAIQLPTTIAAPATPAIAISGTWYINMTVICSSGTFTAQVGSIEEIR